MADERTEKLKAALARQKKLMDALRKQAEEIRKTRLAEKEVTGKPVT